MLWLATRGFTYVTHCYRPMFFHSAWPLSKKIENHRQGRPSHLQNIRRAKNGPCRIPQAVHRRAICCNVEAKRGDACLLLWPLGGPLMARTDLCRRATETIPQKTPVKILYNWLTFSSPNISDDLIFHSSTIYTALIFLCPFNHPYLSILFTTYSIFGLYFRIFLFTFIFRW